MRDAPDDRFEGPEAYVECDVPNHIDSLNADVYLKVKKLRFLCLACRHIYAPPAERLRAQGMGGVSFINLRLKCPECYSPRFVYVFEESC
jgi:rubredoxin